MNVPVSFVFKCMQYEMRNVMRLNVWCSMQKLVFFVNFLPNERMNE